MGGSTTCCTGRTSGPVRAQAVQTPQAGACSTEEMKPAPEALKQSPRQQQSFYARPESDTELFASLFARS